MRPTIIVLFAVIGLIHNPLMAQSYPSTQQGPFAPTRVAQLRSVQQSTPRNSPWAVSPPRIVDQPGHNAAFQPDGFPDVPPDQELDDLSMSPDEWGVSSRERLPKDPTDQPAYVNRFPTENLLPGNKSTPQNPALPNPRQKSVVQTPPSTGIIPSASPGETIYGTVPDVPSSRRREDPLVPTPSNSGLGETRRAPSALELPGEYFGPQSKAQRTLPESPMGLPGRYPLSNAPAAPRPEPQQIQAEPVIVPHGGIDSSWETYDESMNREFRPDLGHRASESTLRPRHQLDEGQTFDFENKKREYPPFREILATGKYFASTDINFFKPYFQNNQSITSFAGGDQFTRSFDFGYDMAPGFRAGFESKYGPGLELTYFQFDQASRPSTFVADGVSQGTVRANLPQAGGFSALSTTALGEQLVAEQGLDIQQIGIAFFKELKFPISRLNGIFGVEYASIQHRMRADLLDGVGSITDSLVSQSDMKAFGPRIAFEYYRPIGHTKLTLVTKFGSTILVGNRDHFVSNTATGVSSRIGADELITKFDFGTSIMYKKFFREDRFFYARFGYDFQTWMGGGNATDPHSDFGFRGVTMTLGINR